uniref:Uncharacterized protein n=1 Tax=Glossina austeni TaxID=7395 RepID=A0A1A9V6N8_GLOAU
MFLWSLKNNLSHFTKIYKNFWIFFQIKITFRELFSNCPPPPSLLLALVPLAPADEGNEPVAIFEKGTGSENLMVCSSCITILETFRNDSFRRDPIADLTPKVLSIKG